jgi:Fic family protein
MLLGEAASKCEHLAGVPLKPKTAERLHLLYLAKGALATTAIEGNTLTEEEVLKRIQGTLRLPPSKEYLGHEIDNIVHACNEIRNEVAAGKPLEISAARIQHFNRQVLAGLPLREEVVPGEIRTYSVGVGAYRDAPAENCAYLLDRLCTWLNSGDFKLEDAVSPLVTAVLKAIVAHLYIAWIHPFGDGNGRAARLVEFQILLDSGFPAPAAQLLSNHYNQTRSEYYRQLDYTSRSKGDEIPFLEYAAQGLVDGLRDQIAEVQRQQLELAWQDYVHEILRGKGSTSDRRRLQLILDLSQHPEPVRRTELPRISPEVAALYVRKGPKTLTRDINYLLEKGLLVADGDAYRAQKEIILAFLPVRRKPSH